MTDPFVLEEFLPYRLNRLAAKVSAGTRAIYRRRYDLTVPEWRVLALLAAVDHLTSAEIGRASAMHKSKVSRATHALEERRWLTRELNRQNRREEFLSLTKLGRAAFQEIAPDVIAFEQKLIAGTGIGKDEMLDMIARLEGRLRPQKGAAHASST